MKFRPEMTQDILKEFVEYDVDTGVMRRIFRMNRCHQKVPCDFIPSSVTAQGYFQINMFKTPYLVHRLAFLYVTGEMPIQVDHINGNRLDNRWSNLRAVNNLENHKNVGVSVRNRSGVKGVYFYPRYGKWEVTITCDGEHHYLGRYADFDEAVRVRRAAEQRLMFHPNHGRRPSWQG